MKFQSQLIEAQIKYTGKFTDLWKPFNSLYKSSSRIKEVEKAVDVSRKSEWPVLYNERLNRFIRNHFSHPNINASVALEQLCKSPPISEIQLLLDYPALFTTLREVPFLELYRLLEIRTKAPDKTFTWTSSQEAYLNELTCYDFFFDASPTPYRWLCGSWFYSPDLVMGVIKNEFICGDEFHIFDLIIWCLYKRRCEETHGENNPHDQKINLIYKTAYNTLEPYMNQLVSLKHISDD
jgi:hypothetical protein